MSKNKLLKSTSVVVLCTLMSRVLGLVRDRLIGITFGPVREVDAFLIAFRIPNLFRRLLAEGSLTISFIPVYTDYVENRSKKESLELAQKTFSILIVILTIVVLMGVLFSPYIVKAFAYGFDDPEIFKLTVHMNRYLFLYLFQVGIVAFTMGYLNTHRVFFPSAFSPVLLNTGFIIGALFLSNYFDEKIWGLVVGVLIGGFLQIILQIPYMVKKGFKLKISIDLKHPGIRRIFKMIAPALFGMAVYQINILVSTLYASTCPEGSVTYLYFCDRLTELVLGVFIISIGNVILPEMSSLTANNEIEKMKNIFSKAASVSLILAIPASFALIAIGMPLVSLLFQGNKFTAIDVKNTYSALRFAAIAVPSLAILRITTPTFYSLKDTLTPVIAAIVAFVTHAVLGYYLKNTSLSYAGLSLSNSISASIQAILLLLLLYKKIGKLNFKDILMTLVKVLLASLAMSFVILSISKRWDWLSASLTKKIIYMGFTVICGGSTYLIICIALQVKEIKEFLSVIYKKLIN